MNPYKDNDRKKETTPVNPIFIQTNNSIIIAAVVILISHRTSNRIGPAGRNGQLFGKWNDHKKNQKDAERQKAGFEKGKAVEQNGAKHHKSKHNVGPQKKEWKQR